MNKAGSLTFSRSIFKPLSEYCIPSFIISPFWSSQVNGGDEEDLCRYNLFRNVGDGFGESDAFDPVTGKGAEFSMALPPESILLLPFLCFSLMDEISARRRRKYLNAGGSHFFTASRTIFKKSLRRGIQRTTTTKSFSSSMTMKLPPVPVAK